jgi:hypothetical protein
MMLNECRFKLSKHLQPLEIHLSEFKDDGRYTQILKDGFLFSLVPQVEFTANTAIRQQVEL